MNGMMTGVVSDGMKIVNQTYNTSVSSFSLESSEWVKMNLDTGAAVNTFPLNFGREGAGDGTFYDLIQMVKLGNVKDTMKMVCPDL